MNERAKAGDSREYFEAIAPEWDAVRKTLFRDDVRGKALAAAGIVPGRRSGSSRGVLRRDRRAGIC